MPKNIHTQDSSQQRASRLLLAMGVIVLVLTMIQRRVSKDQIN